MTDKQNLDVYDDDDIPPIDLPQEKLENTITCCSSRYEVEPLPESTRPRQDGPGGA